MDCEANTFFGVMNAFRGLNVFSLLPLSRQEYMLMFLVFRHRKTNPEGCTVSTLTRLMRVPAAGQCPGRCVDWRTTATSAGKSAGRIGATRM